jgi:pimeloyl-ACP methyl ester carboxylesterase
MLAFDVMAPRPVRPAMTGRPTDVEAGLRALSLPVLVTHGEHDTLVDVSMARYTTETVSGAKLSLYRNVGHAQLWEDASRFNRELARPAARWEDR